MDQGKVAGVASRLTLPLFSQVSAAPVEESHVGASPMAQPQGARLSLDPLSLGAASQ